MQLGLDPSSLIFIDETWIKTNMTRLRGRSPQGRRLVEKVPHGHWKTTRSSALWTETEYAARWCWMDR